MEMDRDELLAALEMFAKNWLAHDGCWFLAAEERFDMATAMSLDEDAWRRFAATEARRIMKGFDIPQNGGLEALERALALRMYAVINEQHVEWSGEEALLRSRAGATVIAEPASPGRGRARRGGERGRQGHLGARVPDSGTGPARDDSLSAKAASARRQPVSATGVRAGASPGLPGGP